MITAMVDKGHGRVTKATFQRGQGQVRGHAGRTIFPHRFIQEEAFALDPKIGVKFLKPAGRVEIVEHYYYGGGNNLQQNLAFTIARAQMYSMYVITVNQKSLGHLSPSVKYPPTLTL